MNRRTLKTEKSLASSRSRKSAPKHGKNRPTSTWTPRCNAPAGMSSHQRSRGTLLTAFLPSPSLAFDLFWVCNVDSTSTFIKNEKSAQRGSFRDGRPADIRGSFVRISRAKTSVRALETLENKHFGADIRDPKARTSTTPRGFQKLRSEKLWAEFSFPTSVCSAVKHP